jgi:medium-chain acyl-[acyl-carrier-protein] hydrolase
MAETESSSELWALRPRPRLQARLRLFCFPFAGSGSIVYRNWPERIGAGVETCLVELPGRGRRLREPLCRELIPLVDAATAGLLPFLDRPFAFFGHSMGALLSFEIARCLRRNHFPQPARLFVSGHQAPHLPETHRPLHDLPDAEFLHELRDLNGTPREVLENDELMQLLVPILRADFSVCETYMYTHDAPLGCAVTVIGGLQDPHLTRENLEAWREQTSASCRIHMFPGDHFLLQSHEDAILDLVNRTLDQTAGDNSISNCSRTRSDPTLGLGKYPTSQA